MTPLNPIWSPRRRERNRISGSAKVTWWAASIVLAASFVLTTSLAAQAPTPQPSVVPSIAPGPAAKPTPNIIRVTRPPASIASPRAAHLSTAQRVAASNRAPLLQLPAFAVADRDGKPMLAGNVPHATHWLLLVREEICLPCDRLMNGLAATESPALTGGVPYVIVVAGKTQESVERVRGAFPALSSATWLVDTTNQAIPALKARGTPMLYALEGSRIAWQVPGTLAQPSLVEKMAAAWMVAKPLQTNPIGPSSTSKSTATPTTSVSK